MNEHRTVTYIAVCENNVLSLNNVLSFKAYMPYLLITSGANCKYTSGDGR